MTHSLPRQSDRFTLLDPLRILASFSVAYTHTTGSMLFGLGFGLFLFLVMLFTLATGSGAQEPLRSFARRKGAYLLAPWVRWSIVYGLVFLVADVWILGQDPRARFEPEMLLYGAKIDLWFLPFAAAALILLRAIDRPRADSKTWVIALCAVGAIALTLLMVSTLQRFHVEYPYRQWISAVPALLFGMALGRCRKIEDEVRRHRLLFGVALLALGACLTPMAGLGDDLVRRYAAAVSLVCLALVWRPRVPQLISKLATASFGIYLVHPLIVLALKNTFEVTTWEPTLHTALVWSLSCALVFVLRRLPVGWSELPRPVRTAALAAATPARRRSRAA